MLYSMNTTLIHVTVYMYFPINNPTPGKQLQYVLFQMDLTIQDVTRRLVETPTRPRTLQEWISQINLCILLALTTETVEQFGMIRFHVRRASELFKLVKIMHERRLEGETDVEIILDEVGDVSDPPSWSDWFHRVQYGIMRSSPLAIKDLSSKSMEEAIEHLDTVYHELNGAQSNMEGLAGIVQNYI